MATMRSLYYRLLRKQAHNYLGNIFALTSRDNDGDARSYELALAKTKQLTELLSRAYVASVATDEVVSIEALASSIRQMGFWCNVSLYAGKWVGTVGGNAETKLFEFTDEKGAAEWLLTSVREQRPELFGIRVADIGYSKSLETNVVSTDEFDARSLSDFIQG